MNENLAYYQCTKYISCIQNYWAQRKLIFFVAAGKIIVGPRDSTYEENQTAVFKCKYHGNPHPEMKWFLGKKQIKSGNKYFISNKNHISTLEIDELTSEDGGYYSVVVSNEAGEDEVTFHLTVSKYGVLRKSLKSKIF